MTRFTCGDAACVLDSPHQHPIPTELPKKDLVEQFLAFEVKRCREGLQTALERMREEIDQAILDLARGNDPVRPSGLANNLTDCFHRLGGLAQLRQFASLTKPEATEPPKVRPDRYRLKLTPAAAEGADQALREWALANFERLHLPMVGDLLAKMPVKVQAGELTCTYAGVEEAAKILRAYANSPRGSAGRRRAAKAVAERLERAKQASDER